MEWGQSLQSEASALKTAKVELDRVENHSDDVLGILETSFSYGLDNQQEESEWCCCGESLHVRADYWS